MNIKETKLYQNKEWLQQQIEKYKHVRTISEIYGISEWTINHWISKLDVKKHDLRRMSSRKINVNENYFEIIDSEEKAYWLGFIMADGCVTQTDKKYPPNRFHLCLKEDDKSHIEKFKEAIQSNNEIAIKAVENKKRNFESITCELRINSKIFVSFLMNNGIVQQKTGKELIPNTVPQYLIRHFIRGYFDGDGSITVSKAFRICSASLKILEDIVEHFKNELDIMYSIYQDKKYTKPFYTIDSRNYFNNKIVLDYLYKDATVFLDRKHERYLSIYCPIHE